jgi:hypothetical protein
MASLVAQFQAIPSGLRILTAASLGVGAGFVALTLIPGATFTLSGTQLSWKELWDTRVAFATLLTGGLMFWTGVAILMRRRWVRAVLVVMPLLQILPFVAVHWVFGAPVPVPSTPFFLLSCAAWAVLATFYLFATRAPREYFKNAA